MAWPGLDGVASVRSVYTCDCAAMQGRCESFAHMDTSFTAWPEVDEFERCQHIIAVESLVQSGQFGPFDVPVEGAPVRMDDPQLRFDNAWPVCVLPAGASMIPCLSCCFEESSPCDRDRFIVKEQGKCFKCTTCRSQTFRCSHIKQLEEWYEEYEGDTGCLPACYFKYSSNKEMRPPQSGVDDPAATAKAHSYEPISDNHKLPAHDYIGSDLCPPVGTASRPKCECGQDWCAGDPQPTWPVKEAKLSGMAHTRPVRVYSRPCSARCGKNLPYDGQADSVFNFSTSILFHYSLMFSYFRVFATSTYSFTAHWRAMGSSHIKNGSGRELMPSRTTLRLALLAFLTLLVTSANRSFICPCCCRYGFLFSSLIIILDGTTLGFRKDFARTATPGVDPNRQAEPEL
jgi:hypothetical protein